MSQGPPSRPLPRKNDGFSSPPSLSPSRSTNFLDPKNLPKLPKQTISFSRRSVSTTMRLRRQGFRSSTKVANFAVKSIRRGSDEWSGLLKPFVADLVFHSLEYRRSHSEVSFRPYTCRGASVLFVDLSSYSAITRLIAHRGPHALSGVVNSYFQRLLAIVQKYGGDVCKFAGDAVLCVWEGGTDDMDWNNRTAVLCALEMQEKAGSHRVDGTPLSFRIHAGVCCGLLESEIFEAPSHTHMQRLYHSLGGDSLAQLGEAVNFAKAGEVCVSKRVLESLDSHTITRPVAGREEDYAILGKYRANKDVLNEVEARVEQLLTDRLLRRNQSVEEDFIHPSVLRLLGHGGLSPTQIAQMRDLCVLFIAKTTNSSSVNWLKEISSVLDSQRCPIVQIVDDDKAVHVIAAINLYEAVPESSVKGIDVCAELVAKEAGCAIGMACGPTFCGVTGCSDIACRWDITGPPAVRAARLMQYAVSENIHVAVDHSVNSSPGVSTRLSLTEKEVHLKGTEGSVPVYTLAETCLDAAFRVQESLYGRAHEEEVNAIAEHIGKSDKSAVLITGPQFSGKKIVAQRAAGISGLVPYLHISDESAGFLQLARTIATWFRYSEVNDVSLLAEAVLRHLRKKRLSRAHDDCIALIDMAVSSRLRACFIIDRVQFLDDFSLSMLRESLQTEKLQRTREPSIGRSGQLQTDSMTNGMDDSENSKVCFLCVHVPFYHWPSGKDIVEGVMRSKTSLEIPIFEVCEATAFELRTVMNDVIDCDVNDRWLEIFSQASGGCVGYCLEKTFALRSESGRLWQEGKHGYTQLTNAITMTVTPGKAKAIHQFAVHRVSTEVAMKFSQMFDGLPPVMQILCKVLSLSAQTGFYKIPRFVLWETLNDLISDGVELDTFELIEKELVDLFVLKREQVQERDTLSFQCPAMSDTALGVCTPVQVSSIAEALISRLEPMMQDRDFRVPFAIANLILHQCSGEKDRKQDYQKDVFQTWQLGYAWFLEASESWSDYETNKWKERFDNELNHSSLEEASSLQVFGENFCLKCWATDPVDPLVTLLKLYSAPVCLGPMAQSLTIICRNLFHSCGKFHGHEKSHVHKIEKDLFSASRRYLKEVAVVEEFLSRHGLGCEHDELDKEHVLISSFSSPSTTEDNLLQKVSKFLNTYSPGMIEGRLQRLHKLVRKLRAEAIPDIVQRADIPILRAYSSFRLTSDSSEGAERALMILATANWRPRLPPEFLPITSTHTVARIRNKCFKALTSAELAILKHQQTHESFEAFLVTTPLLYESFGYRKYSQSVSSQQQDIWGPIEV